MPVVSFVFVVVECGEGWKSVDVGSVDEGAGFQGKREGSKASWTAHWARAVWSNVQCKK